MSGQVLLGLEPEDGYCLYITELDYTAVYGSSGWVNMGGGGGTSSISHQALIGAGTRTHSELDSR